MNTKNNLKEVERLAFRDTFQDGLWDILIGLFILAIGVSITLSTLGFERPFNLTPALLIGLAGYAGIYFAKQTFTIPRIGLVEFAKVRRQKTQSVKRVMWVLAVLLIVLLVVLLTGWVKIPATTGSTWQTPAVIGAAIAIGLSLAITYLGLPDRLHIYAWTFGFSFPSSAVLEAYAGITFPIAFILSALIALVIGVFLLAGFLRENPLPIAPGEENDEAA